MPGTTIVAHDIEHRYRETIALAGVSFTLGTGVTGLLGPNGAGKTTLLSIVATALAPDSGDLRVLGYRRDHARERAEIRRRLGFMPQNPGFYPRFLLAEFIDYMAILKEITSRRERRAEVERVLTLTGLQDRRGKRMKTLSGGMLQRAALAVALIGDPELLILDEPMVGLDPEQRLRLRELIADLGETRTVILSTHQTEDVTSLCQQVIVLHRGKAVFEGEPATVTQAARERVWISDERPAPAQAVWRTGTGRYRSIGDPPPGAELVEPTLEDGYLVLIGGLSEGTEVLT